MSTAPRPEGKPTSQGGQAGAARGTGLSKPSPESGRTSPQVIVLRERARSVRPEDQPSRAGFRLGLTCACAAAAIVAVWIVGHLGFRLGAAPTLGVPELLAKAGEGLATGTATFVHLPVSIYSLALHEPLVIVVAFAAIAIPAAGLAAARRPHPGGPRPATGTVALATLGAVIGLVVCAALVTWTLSPWRAVALAPMPAASADIASWAQSIDRVAGVDALALITLVLWCVLMPRLPLPEWLRILAMVLVLFAASIGLVGAAISGASAAHLYMPRSIVRLETGAPALLLGYTRGHTVLMRDVDGVTMIVLLDDSERMIVTDRGTVAEIGTQAE